MEAKTRETVSQPAGINNKTLLNLHGRRRNPEPQALHFNRIAMIMERETVALPPLRLALICGHDLHTISAFHA
jgi:hypothetical protein